MFGPIIYETGQTIYAIIDGVDANVGTVYRTTTEVWEVLDTNARSSYAISLTETPAGKGKYYGTLPSGLDAYTGYPIVVYEQAGGSPAASDPIAVFTAIGPIASDIRALNGEAASPLEGVALESSVQEVNDKLGDWEGSGDNTILGGVRAIASKSANLPDDIGGTFTPTTDSLEAISEVVNSGGGFGSIYFTGLEDTYLTPQSAEIYFGNRGNADDWDNANDDDKLKSLLYATKLIERLKYLGTKSVEQKLEFPRDADIMVPEAIQFACAEIALSLLGGASVESEYAEFYNQSELLKYEINPFYLDRIKAGIPSEIAWQYLLPYLAKKFI